MNRILIIINIALIIAVGVLYFLFFKSRTPQEEVSSVVISPSAHSIAYVNFDSLLTKYKFYKEKSDEFEKKQLRKENELRGKGANLQKEYESFQRNAPNMTVNQGKAAEEEIMRKQQGLMQEQERVRQELMVEQSKFSNQLYDSITTFLKGYGKKNKLQVVLSFSKGNDVLYANDSLDITSAVLKGLNEKYETKK